MPLKEEKTALSQSLGAAFEKLVTSKKSGKVGWFGGEKYRVTTKGGTKTREVSVAYVAAIQEYGDASKNIPDRLGMRETASKKSKDWDRLAFNLAKKIPDGVQTAETVLEAVSQVAAGDLRKHITEVQSPALAASTVKARLRKYKDQTTVGNLNKPLIDSGILLNTLTSKVD